MNTEMQNENTAPVHTARAGSVRASVWESTGQSGLQYKVMISRSYRQNDVWRPGHTFYHDQLASLVEAVAKAQSWIERRRRLGSGPNLGQI